MPKHATRAATMILHSANRRGSVTVYDADLVQLSEMYPDLEPVLKELQYLREQDTAALYRGYS